MRNRFMAEAAGTVTVMTSLAMVDVLRSLGTKKIAVNCTYYESTWRDAFASFMVMCGFDIVHLSTLSDLRLTEPDAKMEDYGWSMTDELTWNSIDAVAQASPDAEAIVVTGAGTRTLSLLNDMERHTGRPIVAADTSLYWAIARELNLTLTSMMGALSALPKDHISRG